VKQVIDVDGIELHLEGDGPTVLMVHGWPDTYRMWDRQVAALRGRYRCARFTLPGFDTAAPPRPASLDETVELLRRMARAACPDGRVTLLLHDWGCVFGFAFYTRYPMLVERIVAVDVGDTAAPEFVRSLSLAQKAMAVSYQLWLAAAWRIGGRVGDRMARVFARIGKAPVDPARVGAQQCYPYYIAWTGRYGSYKALRPLNLGCPLLFVYGERKPLLFHAPQWARQLAHKPGCRVLAMPTGHWPMVQQPGPFNAALLEWLDGR
jgi:pimeloyl-ACP methyl ester carboxylesterase